MKKIITTALATMVAVYGYSQTYLPITGGDIKGGVGFDGQTTLNIINNADIYGRAHLRLTGRLDGGNDGWGISSRNNIIFAKNTGAQGAIGEDRFAIQFNMLEDKIGFVNAAGTPIFRLDQTGFLTGTSATFSDNISANGHSTFINNANGASWSEASLEVRGSNNPGIGFHHPGIYASSLYMNSSGTLNWNGSGFSTLKMSTTGHNTFINNADGASWSEAGLEIQGSNNPAISFHHPGQYAASLYMNNGGNLKWGGSSFSCTSITGNSGTFSNQLNVGSPQGNANLYVYGTIKSKEVKVESTVSVPDYVFEKSYDLKPLAEIEVYVNQNKHLPEIPSAKEIEKEGIKVGEMQMQLLEKIEELTLHLIEQDKKNAAQQKEIEELKAKLNK